MSSISGVQAGMPQQQLQPNPQQPQMQPNPQQGPPQMQQGFAGGAQQPLEACLAQLPAYTNLPRLTADVTFLLNQIRTLKPHVKHFGSPNGATVQLFVLGGTFPIQYKGGRYNIPLTMYFDPPYPSKPPRCFITPSDGMRIKDRHNHVDRTGMVYLPYLNQWQMACTCGELIACMQQVFGEDPPVFATASASSQPRPAQQYGGNPNQSTSGSGIVANAPPMSNMSLSGVRQPNSGLPSAAQRAAIPQSLSVPSGGGATMPVTMPSQSISGGAGGTTAGASSASNAAQHTVSQLSDQISMMRAVGGAGGGPPGNNSMSGVPPPQQGQLSQSLSGYNNPTNNTGYSYTGVSQSGAAIGVNPATGQPLSYSFTNSPVPNPNFHPLAVGGLPGGGGGMHSSYSGIQQHSAQGRSTPPSMGGTSNMMQQQQPMMNQFQNVMPNRQGSASGVSLMGPPVGASSGGNTSMSGIQPQQQTGGLPMVYPPDQMIQLQPGQQFSVNTAQPPQMLPALGAMQQPPPMGTPPILQNAQVQQQQQLMNASAAGVSGEFSRQQQLQAAVTARVHRDLPVVLRPVVASIQEQLDVGEKLQQHGNQLRNTVQDLEAEAKKQDQIIEELEQTKLALQAAIKRAEDEKDVNIDEFLEPRDVLSRQLVDLIAEDCALEDSLSQLDESLKEKTLTVDAWLLEVRDCVKRQFYARELKKKVMRAIKLRKMNNPNNVSGGSLGSVPG
ncbi:unnamed protein product [Amoebophrya sp. A120]|nr:unnamed protein product [Amoebophrya sp. A120]|eukprot:GSA120T00011417001.1